MKKKETPQYTILSPDFKKGTKGVDEIDDFFSELKENFSKFKNSNLILDFSHVVNTDERKILLFSQLSDMHRSANNSFVMVCRGIEFNDLPDEMMAVPTLQEAQDIVEIEDIERDLGI